MNGLFWGLPELVHAQGSWQATYWNNSTLTGNPVLTRQELAVDHDWGAAAPAPQVNRDNFSVRWTRTERLAGGTYRFTATADDGIRLWMNGVRILDDWQVGSIRTVTADIYLSAGSYETRVEYFEASGFAAIMLDRVLLNSEAPVVVPAPAEDPALGTTSWRGEYYNNGTLGGSPALVRGENNIDFRWGSGSPAPGIIAPDRFSARWTRTLDLKPGRYRFAVTADDGVRLYLNDQLLIDQWQEQAATTYTVETDLPGGATAIRLEYYENRDQATARFSYAKVISEISPTAPALSPTDRVANWRGEYFDNVNLSGPPSFVRSDNVIDFDWAAGSPAPNALGVDRFSVRWTDTLDLTPGRYRFIVVADDGVRLRINGEIVIDEFTVQSARNYAVERDLPDGRAQVVMEYFENTGQAVARLSWQRVDGTIGSSSGSSNNSSNGSLAGSDAALAVVAGAANLNVRSGPSANYGAITTLARGQTIPMIGRNRTTSWIQIQLPDGRTGWVNRRYLSSGSAYRTLPIAG